MITATLLNISIALFGVIFYTYVGYPMVLWMVCRVFGGRAFRAAGVVSNGTQWPEVSIVLTMHNAAGLAAPKLANLATIDYPGEINVNFVLDGCTDGTELHIQRAIETGYRFPVYIWPQAERLGKESAIRGALPHLPGKVLMFSDADAVLASDAVRLLVQALLEKDVGVACGKEIHLTQSGSGAGSGHGLFYRYEHAVKQLQAQVTSLTYVQGGVFAMWKDLYPPAIPLGATQDGAIAFNAVLSGKRVVYVDEAESTEPYHLQTSADFARRIRTVSRAFYTVTCYPQIFLPTRTGSYGFHVFSGRFLRWVTIPIAVLANLLMIKPLLDGVVTAQIILICELVWILLAACGFILERCGVRWKLAYFCFYFSYIHFAAAMAVIRVVFGHRTAVWKPTN